MRNWETKKRGKRREKRREKTAMSFLFQVIIEILIVIAVLIMLIVFVSKRHVEQDAVDMVSFLSGIFDNATIKLESERFNVKNIFFVEDSFVLEKDLVKYRSRLFVKKRIDVNEGIISISPF